jgi:hypothetical protein
MALIDEVRTILNRLAPFGWKDLFAKHKLDITAVNLQAELERLLPGISRDAKGFESFTIAGIRAIEPGSPARSLLYHALASADVHPTANGNPSQDSNVYPTIDDLDTIENYIYSRARRTLRSFTNPVIVVSAYQYQNTLRSAHGKHADLSFSRTGISRLGTEAYRYEKQLRSFSPLPRSGDRGFAVLPARYGAFIAEYRNPSSADAILRKVSLDPSFIFAFPVHKLFAGKECLFNPDGSPIDIQSLNFVEYHINEKLRRIHTNSPDNLGFVPPLSMFDINKPPFKRDSKDSPDLVFIEKHGSSILLVPQHHATIARTATQQVNGKNELARFVVPPEKFFGPPENGLRNRFATSLGFPTDDPTSINSRTAPSFANIRYEVLSNNGQQTVRNLATLPDAEYNKKLAEGNYEAAHFIDDNSEGAIGVEIKGLSLPILSAYSIVSSIDLFPKVDQIEIQKWLEKITRKPTGFALPDIHFLSGGPKPLNDGRFVPGDRTLAASQRIPNPTLPNPMQVISSGNKAFTRSEAANLTATAIVSNAPFGIAFNVFVDKNTNSPLSWLPDTASDVFEPGWDIAVHKDSTGPFYASYGLGSPFQEDGKICAALNSFWPAATPDTARTFGITGSPTAFPMMDNELGYHPQHPRAIAKEVQSRQGWDGLFGPFFESVNGKNYANFADFNRADYATSSLQNLFGFNGLELNTATEMIARMDALRFCIRVLPPGNDTVPNNKLLLIVAEKVNNWKDWNSKLYPRANSILTDAGYIYIFVEVINDSTDINPSNGGVAVTNPPIRRRYEITNRYECQIDSSNLFFRVDNGLFQRRSYNPTLPELPVLNFENQLLV